MREPADGIKYSADMFDNSSLVKDIVEYVSVPFKEEIENTLNDFNRRQ